MERWQEYLPVSSACLLSTFDRAMQRRLQFSPAERALFMACQFWSAVLTRTLVAHGGSSALDTLRYMSMVYAAMGAHEVANEMISAIGELAGAAHRQAPRQCLSRLQEKLLETADPVDLLIARLAERLGLGSGDGAKWEYGPDEIALFA